MEKYQPDGGLYSLSYIKDDSYCNWGGVNIPSDCINCSWSTFIYHPDDDEFGEQCNWNIGLGINTPGKLYFWYPEDIYGQVTLVQYLQVGPGNLTASPSGICVMFGGKHFPGKALVDVQRDSQSNLLFVMYTDWKQYSVIAINDTFPHGLWEEPRPCQNFTIGYQAFTLNQTDPKAPPQYGMQRFGFDPFRKRWYWVNNLAQIVIADLRTGEVSAHNVSGSTLPTPPMPADDQTLLLMIDPNSQQLYLSMTNRMDFLLAIDLESFHVQDMWYKVWYPGNQVPLSYMFDWSHTTNTSGPWLLGVFSSDFSRTITGPPDNLLAIDLSSCSYTPEWIGTTPFGCDSYSSACFFPFTRIPPLFLPFSHPPPPFSLRGLPPSPDVCLTTPRSKGLLLVMGTFLFYSESAFNAYDIQSGDMIGSVDAPVLGWPGDLSYSISATDPQNHLYYSLQALSPSSGYHSPELFTFNYSQPVNLSLSHRCYFSTNDTNPLPTIILFNSFTNGLLGFDNSSALWFHYDPSSCTRGTTAAKLPQRTRIPVPGSGTLDTKNQIIYQLGEFNLLTNVQEVFIIDLPSGKTHSLLITNVSSGFLGNMQIEWSPTRQCLWLFMQRLIQENDEFLDLEIWDLSLATINPNRKTQPLLIDSKLSGLPIMGSNFVLDDRAQQLYVIGLYQGGLYSSSFRTYLLDLKTALINRQDLDAKYGWPYGVQIVYF